MTYQEAEAAGVFKVNRLGRVVYYDTKGAEHKPLQAHCRLGEKEWYARGDDEAALENTIQISFSHFSAQT